MREKIENLSRTWILARSWINPKSWYRQYLRFLYWNYRFWVDTETGISVLPPNDFNTDNTQTRRTHTSSKTTIAIVSWWRNLFHSRSVTSEAIYLYFHSCRLSILGSDFLAHKQFLVDCNRKRILQSDQWSSLNCIYTKLRMETTGIPIYQRLRRLGCHISWS